MITADLNAGLHFPWCGAGASLNIECCDVVRAPALNDCAVQCGGQTFRPAQGSTGETLPGRRCQHNKAPQAAAHQAAREYPIAHLRPKQPPSPRDPTPGQYHSQNPKPGGNVEAPAGTASDHPYPGNQVNPNRGHMSAQIHLAEQQQ